MNHCHFLHDNHNLLLDQPTLDHNHSLKLIETVQQFPDSSLFSLTCFEKPNQQATYDMLIDEVDGQEDSLGMSIMKAAAVQQESEQSVKRKKTGCTCKKTNCVKMYCQCFSAGKMCTPDCACYGCQNNCEHELVLQKTKLKTKMGQNRHNHKGCNCKKTNCQKKYCECFNAGISCSESCNCSDCHNHGHIHQEQQDQYSSVVGK